MVPVEYVVILTTCFAKLIVVTYGACGAGKVQTFVYCSSGGVERVFCSVEDITIILNITPDPQNYTNCMMSFGSTSYGNTETAVWVANGCRGVFEVCGEVMTTTSSETSIPSTSSTAQLTSTAGTILTTRASDFSNSTPMAILSTAQSVRTTDTTKGIQTTVSVQLSTMPLPSTSESSTVIDSDTTLSSSEKTQTTSNTQYLSMERISTSPVATSILSSSPTANLSSTAARPTSVVTTPNDNNFSAQITIKTSSSKTIYYSSSTAAKPTSATTTSYGNDSNATISTGLSTAKTISISTSIPAKLTSEVSRSYGYSFTTTNGITVSALTSAVGTSSSPLYHTAVTSPIIATTPTHDSTGIGATDISIQHNTAITLSPGVIAGIIAGGLLFIMLFVAYVCIVSSRDPCNSVGPSTDV